MSEETKAPDKDHAMKTASDVGPGAPADPSKFPKLFTIIFAILMTIAIPGDMFEDLENRWVGAMFRIRGMEQIDKRITIVEIDDASLKHIGAYPWPRAVYEKLLDSLFETYGVGVVGFDVLFLDPSGSPKNDRALVRATKKYADKVVHAIRAEPIPGTFNYEFQYPFEPLRKVSKNVGSVSQFLIDDDGQVRSVVLVAGKRHGDNWIEDPDRKTAFGVQILNAYTGKTTDHWIEKVGLNGMRLNIRGQQEITRYNEETGTDVAVGNIYGIPRIPAYEILEKDLDEESAQRLKNGIILVGLTASGSHDHYPSPFHEAVPGVEVHATQIDNLLNDHWIGSTIRLVTVIAALLLILFARWLTNQPPLVAGAGLFGGIALWLGLVYYMFLNLTLIEGVAPIFAFVTTFVTLIIHRTMLEQQQKAEVRAMFGQYVAPEVVDILVKNPKKLSLGGEKRDMTMFFLDIAHFTSISEKLEPEDLIKFLNYYLTALTDDVLNNEGVVDKYIGDCIMAFWNAPLEVADHRTKACVAAVSCISTMKKLNEEFLSSAGFEMPEKPAVRIGLNSGEVVVGNTGSARKLAYTVLGDEVNLSSRLEGANKFFGSTIMASENTYSEEARKHVEARVLGKVRVVGKEIPIKVFELLAKKGQLDETWRKALPVYHEGVDLFNERKFEEAKKKFEEVIALRKDDKPSKLYINMCDDYIIIPPPEDQELVFNLTSK
jgi:adenylate cyclase